jgi:hypothetical protein
VHAELKLPDADAGADEEDDEADNDVCDTEEAEEEGAGEANAFSGLEAGVSFLRASSFASAFWRLASIRAFCSGESGISAVFLRYK